MNTPKPEACAESSGDVYVPRHRSGRIPIGQRAPEAAALLASELDPFSAEQIQAEKLATIALLSAGVAHEVNNPAYAVVTNLGILREEITDLRACLESSLEPEGHAGEGCTPERVWVRLGDFVDLADQCTEAMQRIVRVAQDLADLAAAPHPDGAELLAVAPIVKRAVAMVRPVIEASATLTAELDEGAKALVERADVTQVVLALLRNAIDAVQSSRRRGAVAVRVVSTESTVVIEVEDDGVGAPPRPSRGRRSPSSAPSPSAARAGWASPSRRAWPFATGAG
ncbi:MAG: hypothetical protein R3A52_02165 [Polyangiales bacterium]